MAAYVPADGPGEPSAGFGEGGWEDFDDGFGGEGLTRLGHPTYGVGRESDGYDHSNGLVDRKPQPPPQSWPLGVVDLDPLPNLTEEAFVDGKLFPPYHTTGGGPPRPGSSGRARSAQSGMQPQQEQQQCQHYQQQQQYHAAGNFGGGGGFGARSRQPPPPDYRNSGFGSEPPEPSYSSLAPPFPPRHKPNPPSGLKPHAARPQFGQHSASTLSMPSVSMTSFNRQPLHLDDSRVYAPTKPTSARTSKALPPGPRQRALVHQGLTATKAEARQSYNSIDDELAVELDARVQACVHRCEDGGLQMATGLYLFLERCHNCEVHHKLTTRHEEQQYAQLARQILASVRACTKGVLLDLEEIKCRLEAKPGRIDGAFAHGHEVVHNFSRVGAFEVFLLTPHMEPDALGATSRFPFRATSHQVPHDLEAALRSRTWGARRTLPHSGYTATLIYSKLASKAWPTPQQVIDRLFMCIPRGVVQVRVYSPKGDMLPNFTVEVAELQPPPSPHKAAAPQKDEFRMGLGSLGMDDFPKQYTFAGNPPKQEEPQDKMRMVIPGTHGQCQIEEVPLQTSLSLRVYDGAMRMQAVEFQALRLRIGFAFGSDIVFYLWSTQIPGGLEVSASSDMRGAELSDKSRPYEGDVELKSGDRVAVRGRMQLPWTSFRPEELASPQVFAPVRRFHVRGYHPADLRGDIVNCTMRQLTQKDFIDLGVLGAPEVRIQVVLPGNRQPVAGVRVEVVEEQQRAVTNERGLTCLILRQGPHAMRLMHSDLTMGWVEQAIVVDSMRPALEVPLPVQLKLWRAPITVRGDLYGFDLWLTSASGPHLETWEPYTGSVHADFGEVHVPDGIFSTPNRPVKQLNDTSSLRPASADPISGLAPVPPFARRAGQQGVLDGSEGVASAVPATAALQQGSGDGKGGRTPGDVLCAQLLSQFGPMHMGTCLPGTRGATALCVRALTACCGCGVAGAKVSIFDGAEGVTDSKGMTQRFNLKPDECSIEVETKHPALGGPSSPPLRHTVCLSDEGEPPAGAGSAIVELPLLFEAHLYIFCVETEQGGNRMVQAAASSAAVPTGALSFTGRVVSATGQDLNRTGQGRNRVHPLVPRIDAEALPPGAECPVTGLSLVPDIPGFKFHPTRPNPLTVGGCGIAKLLEEGTLTLGVLKRFFTIVHVTGKEVSLSLDEFPTLGHAAQNLAEMLGEEPGPVALVREGREDTLGRSDEVPAPGMRYRVLATLEVRVVLESSEVGVEDALVVINGGQGTPTGRTQRDGRCQMALTAGTHSVQASHPLLQQEEPIQVQVKQLRTVQLFKVKIRVSVYGVPVNKAAPNTSSIAVWLCARPDGMHPGALPVRGTLRIKSCEAGVDPQAVSLDASTIKAVPLSDEDVQVDGDGNVVEQVQRPLAAMPAGGVCVELHHETHIWEPRRQPWVLEQASEWKDVLRNPIQLGILKAPLIIRCHGFGNDPMATSLVRLPADSQSTAREVCALLAEMEAYKGMQQVAFFLQEHRLSLLDEVPPCEEVDLWPLVTFELQVRARCCGRGIDGVSIVLNDPHAMSGEASSAALQHVVKKGVRVEDKGGNAGSVTKRDLESDTCEVSFSAFPRDPAFGRSVSFNVSNLRVVDELRHGLTNMDGECRILTTVAEEKSAYLTHPIFAGAAESLTVSRRVCLSRGKAKTTEVVEADPVLYVYVLGRVPVAGRTSPIADDLPGITEVPVAQSDNLARTSDAPARASSSAADDRGAASGIAATGEGSAAEADGGGDPSGAAAAAAAVVAVAGGEEAAVATAVGCDEPTVTAIDSDEAVGGGVLTRGPIPDASVCSEVGSIWACMRPEDIPRGACSAQGVLHLPGSGGTRTLEGAHTRPIVLSGLPGAGLDKPLSPCFFSSLVVEAETSPHDLWFAEEAPFGKARGSCGCEALLRGPVLLGLLKPSLTLRFDSGEELRLPADDFGTLRKVRAKAAEHLGVTVDELGLFDDLGQDFPEPAVALSPAQVLVVSLLAPLLLRVLVPESAAIGGKPVGLAGVEVELDGQAVGNTDEKGEFRALRREGAHHVHLRHACFGSEGRQLEALELKHGEEVRRDVMADLRIFVFASKADPDVEEDLLDSSGDSASEGGHGGGAVGTVLVWIASSKQQIQGETIAIAGTVSWTGLGGKQTTTPLTSDVTEIVLVRGEEVEAAQAAAGGEPVVVSLATFQVKAEVKGCCWRIRDPPPLVERAELIGGCEYLRLIACPTVIGYLDPAFSVQVSGGETYWIPVTGCPTSTNVQDRLHELHEVSTEQMALFHKGQSVAEDMPMKPGMALQLLRTARVGLAARTGCCCSPLDGMQFAVGGVRCRTPTLLEARVSKTVSDGYLGHSLSESKHSAAPGVLTSENPCFELPLGRHTVFMEHAALGKSGRATYDIEVTSDKGNSFTFLVDPRLYFYATEPDDEDGLDGEEDMDLFDPTCVWLAADAAHIPDEAVPLKGFAHFQASEDEEAMVLPVEASHVADVILRAGATTELEPCLMSRLSFTCERAGFHWAPKEPSVLNERCSEIGGCELLRVLACPLALGFLKPAVSVFCANGSRVEVPLDSNEDMASLRDFLAGKLGDDVDPSTLEVTSVDGKPMASEAALARGLQLLCAQPGEKLEAAAALHEEAKAQTAAIPPPTEEDRSASQASFLVKTQEEQECQMRLL